MAVEETFDRGLGATRGDVFPWRRRIAGLGGLTITNARITFKTGTGVADPGTLQKSITSVSGADGQIEDTGASTGIAVLRFDFTSTNTLLFTAGDKYVWDLQVTLSDGQILTVLSGTAVWDEQVTVSNP